MARFLGPPGFPDVPLAVTGAAPARPTIRVNQALLDRARAEALRSGRTLAQVVEDALCRSLPAGPRPAEPMDRRIAPPLPYPSSA